MLVMQPRAERILPPEWRRVRFDPAVTWHAQGRRIRSDHGVRLRSGTIRRAPGVLHGGRHHCFRMRENSGACRDSSLTSLDPGDAFSPHKS